MKVYLVQHGEAHPKEVNPERALTERGRRETRQVAAVAARMGLEVAQIRHSGKTRARQTAELLSEALSPASGVAAVSGLAPMDDVRPIAAGLLRESEPVMLVGHLPFMARLAGFLLAGDPEQAVVKFRYSAIICLAHTEVRWQVAWLLTPEMAEVCGG
jgi:phosphohistidine phosphatase